MEPSVRQSSPGNTLHPQLHHWGLCPLFACSRTSLNLSGHINGDGKGLVATLFYILPPLVQWSTAYSRNNWDRTVEVMHQQLITLFHRPSAAVLAKHTFAITEHSLDSPILLPRSLRLLTFTCLLARCNFKHFHCHQCQQQPGKEC